MNKPKSIISTVSGKVSFFFTFGFLAALSLIPRHVIIKLRCKLLALSLIKQQLGSSRTRDTYFIAKIKASKASLFHDTNGIQTHDIKAHTIAQLLCEYE